ncbi:dTDP-4-dehydrorhamnose 3,5-epimerase [mine drainage metagenome]|uniref:dTDP-4-dehydrorhamnose 3,5-epimerase n=1 Tax=mine drainage metagenome TaxID=410659 RepID=T0YQB1_9ZZZZ
MNIEMLGLTGSLIINKEVKSDIRGNFYKSYASDELRRNGTDFDVKEIFYSTSSKNVVRGMHFQVPPFEQAKLVNVVKGNITDVLLDLRVNSESCGKFVSLNLSEYDGKTLYIPRGIAHGFVSRSIESIVLYAVDSPYSMLSEGGIRYDSFGYDWRVENPILSDRDRSFIQFDGFMSPFKL